MIIVAPLMVRASRSLVPRLNRSPLLAEKVLQRTRSWNVRQHGGGAQRDVVLRHLGETRNGDLVSGEGGACISFAIRRQGSGGRIVDRDDSVLVRPAAEVAA